MARRANHNLHVPLPEDTYQDLRDESDRVHQPATTLAREAIRLWLEERRRLRLELEIRNYAQEYAGTPSDLDVDLERATLEHLAQDKGGRYRR